MSIHIYANDHGPAHAYLKDGKTEIRIGQNGKPLAGEPELNKRQRDLLNENKSKLRQAIKKKMAEFARNCK